MQREPPGRTLLDVATECCVRLELDFAHVASSLLDTYKVVDVDVGLLHIL